jgi:quercetin dioxygenase-like cupin family protein
MSTLVALFRLSQRKANNKTKKKGTTMNPLTRFKKIRILALLSALTFAVVVPAGATTQCGLTSTNLLFPGTTMGGFFPSGLLDLMCRQLPPDLPLWIFLMRVQGDSDLYITQNTFQPGGQTGWHTHPGPSMVTVTEGTVTVYEDDCTFATYSVGESFTDIACGDIHNVRNETGAEAKTVAVQLVPHGAVRREDRGDPGCPNVPPCPAF